MLFAAHCHQSITLEDIVAKLAAAADRGKAAPTAFDSYAEATGGNGVAQAHVVCTSRKPVS